MPDVGDFFHNIEPLATIVGAIVAVYAAIDARKSSAEQRFHAEVQNKESNRQGKILAESMLIEYHKAILDWADETIDWMSRSHSLIFYNPKIMPEGEFFNMRAECLWRMSSLIDRGRLFFPNEESGVFDSTKFPANQGLRPSILDYLQRTHYYTGLLKVNAEATMKISDIKEGIVDSKKGFVSEIQKFLDPRARETRLKEIISTPTAVEPV